LKHRLLPVAILAAPLALLGVDRARAENIAGANQMVCTAQHISFCPPFDTCQAGSPVDWNVPDFLVVDVAAKTLSTTGSAEEPRATTMQHVSRDEGSLYLQGVENQRAYSIVIVEATGELAAAVSTPAANISIYGICTPLPVAAPSATH
jgi:hypothetical protein